MTEPTRTYRRAALPIACIRSINERLANALDRLDQAADDDGYLETTDLIGPASDSANYQVLFREIYLAIQSNRPSPGYLAANALQNDLLNYLANELLARRGSNWTSGPIAIRDTLQRLMTEQFDRLCWLGDSLTISVQAFTADPDHQPFADQLFNRRFGETAYGLLTTETPFPSDLRAYLNGKKPLTSFVFDTIAGMRRHDRHPLNPDAPIQMLGLSAGTTENMLCLRQPNDTVGSLHARALFVETERPIDFAAKRLQGAKNPLLALWVGHNDLFNGFLFNSDVVTPLAYQQNLQRMIDAIPPHTKVILIKPINPRFIFQPGADGQYRLELWNLFAAAGKTIPAHGTTFNEQQLDALTEHHRDYCQKIDELAARSNRFVVIDINDPIQQQLVLPLQRAEVITIRGHRVSKVSQLLSGDGIHPEDFVYAEMADWIANALEKAGFKLRPADPPQAASVAMAEMDDTPLVTTRKQRYLPALLGGMWSPKTRIPQLVSFHAGMAFGGTCPPHNRQLSPFAEGSFSCGLPAVPVFGSMPLFPLGLFIGFDLLKASITAQDGDPLDIRLGTSVQVAANPVAKNFAFLVVDRGVGPADKQVSVGAGFSLGLEGVGFAHQEPATSLQFSVNSQGLSRNNLRFSGKLSVNF